MVLGEGVKSQTGLTPVLKSCKIGHANPEVRFFKKFNFEENGISIDSDTSSILPDRIEVGQRISISPTQIKVYGGNNHTDEDHKSTVEIYDACYENVVRELIQRDEYYDQLYREDCLEEYEMDRVADEPEHQMGED